MIEFRRGARSKAKGPVFSITYLLLLLSAQAAIDLSGSATNWTAIAYPGGNYPDPINDHQTGIPEGDLVGDITHPSFYTQFDDWGTPLTTDGTIAFRCRIGADKNPEGFERALFVGIDADQDGDLDLYVGVENSGNPDYLAIWDPGTDLNVSPSTTSIGSAPMTSFTISSTNYSWQTVTALNDPAATSYDLNADGKPDYFLSFSIPFQSLVTAMADPTLPSGGIAIDEASAFTYVMATAANDNSLNQDLNGVGKDYDGTLTWTQLGAAAIPYSATGVMIPEPGTAVLFMGGVALCAWWRRKKELDLYEADDAPAVSPKIS